MPNRILKESICTSTSLSSLTPEEEVFFYRLLVNCDDYGCLDAIPTILRAKCFPLRIDSITDNHIRQWIIALMAADLLQVYQVGGKAYLHIKTWANHQQIRAKKRKYPEPPENGHITNKDELEKLLAVPCNHLQSDAIGNHLQADASKCPRNPIQSNPIQSNRILTKVAEKISADNADNLPRLNKELKKYPPEYIMMRKQVFAGLKTRRGYNSPQPSAEAKTMSELFAEGYTPEDILHVWDAMKPDAFWDNQELTIMSIKKQIGAILKSEKEHKNVSSVIYANGE